MTIEILESAVGDLERGRRFYSRHGQGIGVYRVLDLRQDPESIRDYLKPDDKRKQT